MKHFYYAVDPDWRRHKVIVAYDPFSSLDEIHVFSTNGQFLQVAKRYEREKGAHPQPPAKTPQDPLDPTYLELLQQRHQQQQQDEAQRGVDYHQAQSRRSWSFLQLAGKFAKLLGRDGGISGLSAGELELLDRVHRRHPSDGFLGRSVAIHAVSGRFAAEGSQSCRRQQEGLLPCAVHSSTPKARYGSSPNHASRSGTAAAANIVCG